MVKNLLEHLSGVAEVKSEQESNVKTRLTTNWVDRFGDNPIIKGGFFIQGLYVMRSPYPNGDLRDSHRHTGIDLDPRCMHAGIMCHAISVCIWGSLIPPYAHGHKILVQCVT